MVSQIMKAKDVKTVFNSSQIPGEILDLLVVRTDVLESPRRVRPEVRQSDGGRLVRNDEPDDRRPGAGGDKVLTGIARGIAGFARVL